MSFREAALAYGIPKSTLARLFTKENHNTRLGRPTALSAEDEYAIAKWLSFMAAGGFPVTRQHLVETKGHSLRKAHKGWL